MIAVTCLWLQLQNQSQVHIFSFVHMNIWSWVQVGVHVCLINSYILSPWAYGPYAYKLWGCAHQANHEFTCDSLQLVCNDGRLHLQVGTLRNLFENSGKALKMPHGIFKISNHYSAMATRMLIFGSRVEIGICFNSILNPYFNSLAISTPLIARLLALSFTLTIPPCTYMAS